MKKTALLFLLFFFFSTNLKAQDNNQNNTIITIGNILPLSGPMAFFGEQFKKGVESFLTYYNAEKKAGNKKLKVIFADDGFHPQKTLEQAQDLIENKNVFALLGPFGTPATMAILDYVFSKFIPWIAPASGNMMLNQPPKRNIYPLQPSFFYEGRVLTRFASEMFEKRKVAIIYQNDELGRHALQGVRSVYAEKGRNYGFLSNALPINIQDTDFSAQAKQIAQSNPDTIIIFSFGKTATNILLALKKEEIHAKNTLILSSYINSDSFIFQSKEAHVWEGVYTSSWIKPYPESFLKIWKKYSGLKTAPTLYEAWGWASIEVLAQGIERALEQNPNNLNAQTLQWGLETFRERGSFNEGLSFKVAYSRYYSRNPFCRSPQVGLYLKQIKNKKHVPVTFPTAEEGLYLVAY